MGQWDWRCCRPKRWRLPERQTTLPSRCGCVTCTARSSSTPEASRPRSTRFARSKSALDSEDAENILLAGCEYGQQLPTVDVEAGLRVLHRAEEAAAEVAEANPDPVLQRARHMVALQLGVSLFDAGQLGPALRRLRVAVTAVRHRPTLGLLPIGLNYLAQVETAVGNYREAESLLTEATALHDGNEPDGWHGVNLAYLGYRVVLDRRDPAGLGLLEKARAETELTWQANLARLWQISTPRALSRSPRRTAQGCGRPWPSSTTA